MTEKKNTAGVKPGKIVSYEKMEPELRALFEESYSEGYDSFVVRYPKPNGDSFYAVPLETKDTNYLIKVDVKIDMAYDEDDDKAYYSSDDEGVVDGVGDTDSPEDVDALSDTLADDFSDPA